jgi:hypothetical protein
MKHLIISIVIIWAFFQISSLIWSSKGQPPSATFTRLLEPPEHRLLDPYQNGYYYLLGFAAAYSLDPAKVGHEMWLETTAAPGSSEFNYDKPGRSELQIQLPMEQVLPSWNSQNPVREFRNMKARLQTLTGRDYTLLTRYERWLAMPFEDMGFGYQGIDTKVMAQVFITDDLRLLSTLLSQPTVNKTVLAMTPNIAPPLTTAESSLRWPLQHQFTLGVHGEHTGELTTERQTESLDTHEEWLASAAHLPKQAFRQIAHPHGRSFLGISLRTRETWEMYATYYDAMIHAEETGQSTLPKLYELAGTARQGIVESLFSPNSFEPDWDPFHYQLRETDARLRLASLQVVLRRPSAQTTVPNRLAQVGSSYYDPFSGLPMLWSPTQQKIYSVGKDRYDDGGDVSFDISVPAIVSLAPAPKESQATAPTRPSVRH